MAEVIRALTEMVDKIGLVAAVVIVVIIASAYIVKWNRTLVDKLVEVHNSISTLSNQTISRNTVSMNANTETGLKLVNTQTELISSVKKLCDAFGSDPTRVCQLGATLRKAGYDDETIAIILAKYLKENGKKDDSPT